MSDDIPDHLSDVVCPHFAGIDARTRIHIARAAEAAAAKAGPPSRALVESLRVALTETPTVRRAA